MMHKKQSGWMEAVCSRAREPMMSIYWDDVSCPACLAKKPKAYGRAKALEQVVAAARAYADAGHFHPIEHPTLLRTQTALRQALKELDAKGRR